MKEGRKHEVPLSDAALAVLERAEKLKVNDWVFPGRGLGRINKVGPWELLHKMGYLDENGIPISLHGFRSTFSEWGNTATKYHWQLIELALAHNIKPGVRGDYFRGKLPEQRRPLMEDWGNFCSKPWQQAEVVHLFEKTGND
jgi:integrase